MSSPEASLTYHPGARRLRAYVSLARISNSPTVVSNVLAGATLASTLAFDGTIVMLAIAMVAFYTAGMYLNDLLDYEIDLRERPDRPLPSGAASRTAATVITAVLFGAGLVLLGAIGTAPLLSGVILVAVIIVYDLWHKTNPLSPVLMAITRALVYVTAFLAYSTDLSGELLLWASLLALYIVGLTAIAKTESGPAVAKYWPVAILFLPAVAFVASGPPVPALLLLIAFVAWVLYSLSFAYRSHRRSIGGAIGRLIAGVSLVDALVLAIAGETVAVFVAIGAFGATLFLQRYIRGT